MGRLIFVFTSALALAAVVAACGGSSPSPTTTTPPAATSAPPAATATATDTATPSGTGGEAAQLYAANCAGCHGADGSGGSAPPITGEDNTDRIRQQIQDGGDGMPAFSNTLSADEIDALTQYVAGGLQ